MSDSGGGAVTPDAAASSSGAQGRGRGRSGRGGQGRGRNGSRNPATRKPAFTGNTDGMKGNVFQCHGEHTDKQQFIKTVGVLEEHINKTFTYAHDIASVTPSTLLEPTTYS